VSDDDDKGIAGILLVVDTTLPTSNDIE